MPVLEQAVVVVVAQGEESEQLESERHDYEKGQQRYQKS